MCVIKGVLWESLIALGNMEGRGFARKQCVCHVADFWAPPCRPSSLTVPAPSNKLQEDPPMERWIASPRSGAFLFSCRSMAPPAQSLPGDIIPEILLRIHPEDPASIVRSSAVSKAWRRILADPTATARSTTGEPRCSASSTTRADKEAAHFVPATTSSFRPPTADRYKREVLDCRHGRVVLYDYDDDSPTGSCFIVWDPIAGDLHKIPDKMHGVAVNAAVVCTAGEGRCDHRSCSGGPYIVAFASVDSEDDLGDASAKLYSSETRNWSEDTSVHVESKRLDLEFDRPGTLVGDSFYFVCRSGALLRYWYTPVLKGHDYMLDAGIYEKDVLTFIKPPGVKQLGKVIVMPAEDGGLGLASLCRSNKISLWARETAADDVDGDARWVRRRIVDLKNLLPLANPKRRACLSGVSPEDASVVFISTEDGVFTIQLETLQARKVSNMANDVKVIYPFVSFYTETLLQRLSGKLPAPVGEQ